LFHCSMCYIGKVFTFRIQAFVVMQGDCFTIDGVVVKTGIPEYQNEMGEGDSHNHSIAY